MKIIRLEASNVKKIKAVEIEPDGSLVIIGGQNAQGKSSVLDSIMSALGGKRYDDKKMVRDGMKKGYVDLDLGDMKVRRTYTEAGGGVLTVTGADGVKMSSPQTILDSIIGAVSFDPLSFANSDEKKQAETIKELAGLDLSEIDGNIKGLYDERTLVNRNINNLRAKLVDLPFDPSYDEPIVTKKIIEAIRVVDEKMKRIEDVAKVVDDSMKFVESNLISIQQHREKIIDLQEEIKAREKDIKNLEESNVAVKKSIEEAEKERKILLKDMDDRDALDKQLDESEEHNAIYAANKVFYEQMDLIKAAEKESENLTIKMISLQQERDDAIKAAKMPIAELSFSDDGTLTYKGVPFKQASSAEKIRVSVAIGIAMNPDLKVLMIKNGSLLDESNLKMIGKMAELTDAQLWVESVGTREGTSVIMEDGVSRAVNE